MKKRILVATTAIILLSTGATFAAPSGGGGGGTTYNPTATCGPAVNGNGTFPFPSNRQREWPGGSRTPMCGMSGPASSSQYTYVSSFSITYSAPWANTPSYNVTTTYNWTCSIGGGPGSSTSCGLGRVSWCGTAKGGSYAVPPTSNLCAYGSPSSVATNSSTYTWTCYSSTSYGSSVSPSYSDSCSATRLVASCGSANGQLLMTAPTSNLCNSGTPSTVLATGATTYNWTCGYSGATPTACYANKAIMTPQCTDAAYAAADYTSCMNGGACNCYNTLSTGATSSVTTPSATYSGSITFQQDTAGTLFLGSPVGAASFGALMIGYNGPGVSVGNGAIGINTTSPGAAFDMKGLVRISSLSGSSLQRLMITSTGLITTGNNPTSLWAYSGNAIYNLLGGNVGIGTNTPTEKLQVMGNIKANSFLTNSDERLKYNIKPLGSTIDRLNMLTPSTFNWKADNSKDIGLIAQNVEPWFPELIITDNEGMKSIKYSNLIAPVVKSIQEIQASLIEQGSEKLAQQEAKIEQLENRLDKIKALLSD